MVDKTQLHIPSLLQGDRAHLSDCIKDPTERLSLLENLLSTSRSGVVIMDARLTDMPIIYANPHFEYITGYSASEVIGQNARFLYREDSDQPGLDAVRLALREQRACTAVLRNYRKNGTLFWNELSLSPSFDDEGVLTHYIGTLYDVTERNVADLFLAQEASHRSTRRLQGMHAIDRAILSANSSEAVAEAAITHILDLIPCESARFVRLDPETGRGLVLAHWPKNAASAEQQAVAVDADLLSELAHGHYLLVNNLGTTNLPVVVPSGVRSILSVPLQVQNKLLGSLDLYSGKANLFTEEDIQIAQEVASQVALGLSQTRLREQLKNYARNLENRVHERTGELTRIKDRAEAILNNSANGIILAHRQKGIEQTNQAFNDMFACQPDEYFHHPLATLAHADDVAQLERAIQAASAGEEVKRIEIRARRRDQSVFAAEFGVSFIASDDQDFQRIVCTVHDITERKQAEEALREGEERFRLLTEAAPVAIVIADEHGQIVLVNIETEVMFGHSRNDMIGQPVEMLIPTALRGKHVQQRTHYYGNPHSRPTGVGMELSAQRKDGTQFPVEIGLRHIELSSGTLVMSFILDITHRKQVEEELRQTLLHQQELLDLKTRFVAMASHEFRTPLATIMATTDTISAYRSQMEDEQVERRLEKIRDQVEYLKKIMDDVIQVSRPDNNRPDFQPEQADFDAFFRDIIEDFRSRPDIKHQIDYSSNASPLIAYFDKKLMRQTLSNLVQNAIKYSPSGKTVHVKVAREGGQVEVHVKDEGIGIPEADIKHLFEAFHRATNVGTVPGTGLGLAISKEAIELHKGTINLESQVGEGTTVHIAFPVQAAEG